MNQVYLALPDCLYQRIQPTPVPNPEVLLYNHELAQALDLPAALTPKDDQCALRLCGNLLDNPDTCVALGYSGHQFGHYNPQLGDGRAHLIGQVSGLDWQLKGSGTTAYSRSGDGRCALGPAVREYIMSEAMHRLGVPTMRTLAVATTGAPVYRQGKEAGAVVSRLGQSHLRIGSFQYALAQGEIRAMADFAIQHYYPEVADQANPYLALYQAIQSRLIHTLVHWYRIGFIHGVMNTDNIAISGETFDYGPCAMLGRYRPDQVYSSIDRDGRYAFGRQKTILQWNLARLAETLISLVDDDSQQAIALLTEAVEAYVPEFNLAFEQMQANKLGFAVYDGQSAGLIDAFWQLLEQHQWDYTQTFIELQAWLQDDQTPLPEPLQSWAKQWQAQVEGPEALALMQANNPSAVPRNHEVEALIDMAEAHHPETAQRIDDYLDFLAGKAAPTDASWGQANAVYDQQFKTFCGT